VSGQPEVSSAPIDVLVTGPDIAGRRPGGIQQHVQQLLDAFATDPAYRLTAFASTRGDYGEPWGAR